MEYSMSSNAVMDNVLGWLTANDTLRGVHWVWDLNSTEYPPIPQREYYYIEDIAAGVARQESGLYNQRFLKDLPQILLILEGDRYIERYDRVGADHIQYAVTFRGRVFSQNGGYVRAEALTAAKEVEAAETRRVQKFQQKVLIVLTGVTAVGGIVQATKDGRDMAADGIVPCASWASIAGGAACGVGLALLGFLLLQGMILRRK